MKAVPFLSSALWGLAILASFIGSGRWIAVALRVRERAHLGLELAWGFAATLAVGGWLCWLGIAERPLLAVLVALGASGMLLRTRRRGSLAYAGGGSRALRAGLAAFCICMLGLAYAIALFDPRYQAPDDLAAYFLHARQILETGSLHEPFSFRRMASYGGQSFLHAVLLEVAPIGRLNLLDKGVMRVAVGIALLAFIFSRPKPSLLAAFVVSLVVGVQRDPAFNTSSVFSGVLAFVGLWLTLQSCRRAPERPVANGVVTGLCAAAVLSLRQNYGLACALIILFEHVSRGRAMRDPRQLKELSCTATSAALCVGGWALLQVHATGTPLYPLVQGFANPEWNLFPARDLDDFVNAAEKFLGWRPLQLFAGLCTLALFQSSRSREDASLPALAGATLLALLAHIGLLAHVQSYDLERYTSAFTVSTILVVSVNASAAWERSHDPPRHRDRRTWLALAYLLVLLWSLAPTLWRLDPLRTLQTELRYIERNQDPELAGSLPTPPYQSAAPAGAKLLVMLDRPFLLDLRRNDVASLDLPGGASPPPGLHRMDGPAELVEYFGDLGYKWLVAVRPERSQGLYNGKEWTAHARGVRMSWHETPSDVAPWRVMGTTVVRFFRQLDAIARSCRLAYSDDQRMTIDLSQCRFEEVSAPSSDRIVQ